MNVLHTRTGRLQHTVLRYVGLEVKADRTSFKFSSRHHNARQNHMWRRKPHND